MSSTCKVTQNRCTFQWKIENYNYCWMKKGEYLSSPEFVINMNGETTKWKLRLYPKGFKDVKFIDVGLERVEDDSSEYNIKVGAEFSFLSTDFPDPKLLCCRLAKCTFYKGLSARCKEFMKREEFFSLMKSPLIPQDALIVRCNIWRIDGESIESAHIFVRTVIEIEMVNFTGLIKEFSHLEPNQDVPFTIKSFSGEVMATLNLSLMGEYGNEIVSVEIFYSNKNMKLFKIKSCILDLSGKTIENTRQEFSFHDFTKNDKYTFLLTKRNLMKNKEYLLPKDTLSLEFECVTSLGIAFEKIEHIDLRCNSISENPGILHKPPELSFTMKDDFKSIFCEGFLSDMKIRTATDTFPVHKIILSARSPVFMSMFSSDMKEKVNECVYIWDIDSETLRRLLLYIYTDTVESLNMGTASQLYKAADKYSILTLKYKCSTFMKDNLNTSNACQLLVVADLHHDDDLTSAIQDYILENDYKVFRSKEWKQLMERNPKLASETMFRKYI